MNIECILPLKLPLLESPVWDEKLNCLWFVNIFNEPKVYCYNITTRELKEFLMPEMIGCLALTNSPTNQILVALSSRIALLDTTSTSSSLSHSSCILETISIMKHDPNKMRLNDGRIDKLGRLWVGSMRTDGNDDPNDKDGELFCIASLNNIITTSTTTTVGNAKIPSATSSSNNIAVIGESNINDNNITPTPITATTTTTTNIITPPSSPPPSSRVRAFQQVMRNQLAIPNATAFSPDGRTMYWTDSVTRKILSFTLDYVDFQPIIDHTTNNRGGDHTTNGGDHTNHNDNNNNNTVNSSSDNTSNNNSTNSINNTNANSNDNTIISNKDLNEIITQNESIQHDSIVLNETAMVFVDFDHDATLSKEEVPDGATCDAEGYLWVAHFNGSCISRYHPNGTLNHRISLPCKQPTCIAFGGEKLDVLYITSARLLPVGIATDYDGCLLSVTGLNIVGLTESRFIL